MTCTLLGGLPLWLVASLAPQLRGDLGMDETGLGTAVGVSFLVSAVTAVPAGRLVDRIGWRRGAAAAAALSASVLLAIGVLTRSWALLVVLLAVGALGVSLSHPAANTGISDVVPLRRQGLAFGIKQASVPLTTLVAGLSAPLVMHTVGWRAAFVDAAGIALGFLLVLLLTGRRPDPGPEDRPAPSAGTAAQDLAPALGSDRLGRWPLTVLASGAGLVAGATVSLGGFLVLFAVASGMEQDGAGYLLAAGSIASIASRVLSGYLADRHGWDHLTAVAVMMAGGSVGFVALAVGGSAVLLVVGTLLAFALGWSWNGLFALAVVLRSPGAPGSATGVIQTGICLGATAGPPLFGLTVSRLSYSAAWGGAAAASLCGAALILVGLRMHGRSTPPAERGPR
ncbi:MAG: MFS transporter [Actinomycetota bacterium]|nr:MFS transporter [Actinomycetota bacterium]